MTYSDGYLTGYGAIGETLVGGFMVEVDWNKDGDFNDTNENVTSLVRRQAGLSFEYGRDQSTALAPTVAGRGAFTLNNVSKMFSPRNVASPLYGNIKPARPVRVRRLFDTNIYVLFQGHTDDSPINPDRNTKSVQLSLVDSLADFRGFTISTELLAGLRTGEAISIILDQVGWGASRELDHGATVMPWWWEEGTDAFTALETLVRCEGPPAMLTMGADGSIVFKDRHHRLLDAGSITSQDTWHESGLVEPVMHRDGFTYDEAWNKIINTGTASIDVRIPKPVEAVWTQEGTITLLASETKTLTVSGSDPFINAIAPVAATDYQLLTGSVTVSLSRTSGASTTIVLVAGGSGAHINGLQLRAQPVSVSYTVGITASDPSSIADYGARSFPGDLSFASQFDAQSVLDTAVELRAQPLPVVTTEFVVGVDATRADAVLSRNLSDRVTIVETETVLNDDFYIESISHTATSEYDHTISFGCEGAPPDGAVTAANVFIIGSAAVGHRIGSGVLAS